MPLQPTATAPPRLQAAFARWHRVEWWVAVAALATMAGVLVLDVLGREFAAPLLRALGVPVGAGGVFGASKMAVYALIVATYAGIGVATATGSHLVPRAGFRLVPRSWDDTMNRIADSLTAALLLVAALACALLVHGSWQTGLRAPILQWPVWVVQLALPLGFASAALRHAGYARWPALRPSPRGATE